MKTLCFIFIISILISVDLSGQTFTRVLDDDFNIDEGHSVGVNWGDYDNDGYLDLFVSNAYGEKNFFYKNNGDGIFTRITEGTIVVNSGSSFEESWGDYNNDSHLDLFIANLEENSFLLRNKGDGTFSIIESGIIVSENSFSLRS